MKRLIVLAALAALAALGLGCDDAPTTVGPPPDAGPANCTPMRGVCDDATQYTYNQCFSLSNTQCWYSYGDENFVCNDCQAPGGCQGATTQLVLAACE